MISANKIMYIKVPVFIFYQHKYVIPLLGTPGESSP
jgi:hypothetical protein